MTSTARLCVLAMLLAATAVCLRASSEQNPVPLRHPLAEIPLTLDGWNGRPQPDFDAATAEVLKADEYLTRRYDRLSGESADLYVGYYEKQRQGDTIHSPMNCLPAAGWQPLSIARTEIAAGDHAPIDANRYVVQKGLDRRLVLYWYQSHGRAVASDYASKAYLVVDALRLRRTDGALVRVITPIAGSDAAAERAATSFVQALQPVLLRHLPE